MILSDALILPISQLQTEQVMTSQIRSHLEYLVHTYYILELILLSKLMKNLASIAGFNAIIWWFVIVVYFFGPPCIHFSQFWRWKKLCLSSQQRYCSVLQRL